MNLCADCDRIGLDEEVLFDVKTIVDGIVPFRGEDVVNELLNAGFVMRRKEKYAKPCEECASIPLDELVPGQAIAAIDNAVDDMALAARCYRLTVEGGFIIRRRS